MNRTLPAFALLLATLLFAARCKTSDPPEVTCPTGAGEPLTISTMVGADALVEADIEAWASQSSRVLDLTGFPDTVFTPVSLNITRALKGPLSGRVSVLFAGCIGEDGSSIQGPLQTSAGLSSGYFFILEADDYAVVVPQGFFRREDGLLKNPGVASAGITEEDFTSQLHCCDAGL